MKKILPFLLLLLASCTTPISSEGEKIQIVKKLPSADCKPVGQVESKNMLESSALNELINNAGELGGNTMIRSEAQHSGSFSIFRGDVYVCPKD
ncbi:MAG: DUF4156 domain-containing protein [Pseudomonadota bacterium]